MPRNRLTAIAAGLTLAAALFTAANSAEAKTIKLRYGPALYNKSYSYDVYSTTPDHGYEGSPVPGVDMFCSYQRFPVRKCIQLRNGKERCKTVGWRLHQFCNNYGKIW